MEAALAYEKVHDYSVVSSCCLFTFKVGELKRIHEADPLMTTRSMLKYVLVLQLAIQFTSRGKESKISIIVHRL